jgi:hypothetical protein
MALGLACLYFPALAILGGWGWLVAFFAAGMILYQLRNTRIFDGRLALLALAGLVVSVKLRQFILLFPLFGCYLALWLALTPRLPVIPAARLGDLSYGLYIYGWPVEAAIIWLRGGKAAWWQVFALALPADGRTRLSILAPGREPGAAPQTWTRLRRRPPRQRRGSPRRAAKAGRGGKAPVEFATRCRRHRTATR